MGERIRRSNRHLPKHLGTCLKVLFRLKSVNKLNLSGVDLNDVLEVDKLIFNLLEKNRQVKIDDLLKRQKKLENRRKTIDDNSKEAEEVDLEIMKIALEIVAENKKKSL